MQMERVLSNRFISHFGRVSALAVALLLCRAASPAEAPEPVRGIYLGADECTPELVATLSGIGLNTLFVTNNTYDLGPLQAVVALARQHGLRVYWAMFFHGGPEIGRGFEGNPRRFVRQDGTVTQRTTCPEDEVYWQRAAGERALMLARWAADEPGITGIAFDIEMYGGASDYDWDQYCVCDQCWDAYRAARSGVPSPIGLKPADRWPWLKSRAKTEDYASFQHHQVRRITAKIAWQAHEIAPRLQFAILPYGTIFADDILAGFGSEQTPCLAMREDTYSAGYRVDVEADALRLAQEGIHARMLVGCWAYKRAPIEWASHAYLCATRVDGYWLYEEFPWRLIFLKSTPQEREAHRFEGEPAEWQKAFRLANREIDSKLANPAHQPVLPVLRLRRPDYAMDLASLPLAAPSLVKPRVVSWSEAGMHWAGQYIELTTRAPGEQVTFVLPHRYGGPHEVRVYLAGGPDRGIVKVMLDGKQIGKPVDTYAPKPTAAVLVAQGKAALEAQPHLLALRAIGKNAASSGFAIGAECAYLEYDGPFCRDFFIIGPFDNAQHRGFDQVYPPEREIDLAASCPGAAGQRVSWRQVRTDESGFVNFKEFFRPNEWVVAYALTNLYSDRPRYARILVGSDDGTKVWINGEPAWAALEVRGPDPDKDRFEVMLRKGWNRLLVKVEQGTGGWGLHLRATDAGPVADRKWQAQPVGP